MSQKQKENSNIEKLKEQLVEELTKILIKTDLDERKNGEKIYVKKTTCYRDLIKFIKDYL